MSSFSSSSSAPSRAILLSALMAHFGECSDMSNIVEIIEDQPDYATDEQVYVEDMAQEGEETILVDENGHQLTPEEVAALGSNVEFLDEDADEIIDQPMAFEQPPAQVMQEQPSEQFQEQQLLQQLSLENEPEQPIPAMDAALAAAEMRLHVPTVQESTPVDTEELANAVKEPVLDNDYKSILLDITKMVAQARFIMSRAFVGGNQLGGASFVQTGSQESLGAEGGPSIEDTVSSHKIQTTPHRASFKGSHQHLSAGEQ